MFFRVYPITLRALLFLLLLMIATVSISLWVISKSQQEFIQKHADFAEHSVKAAANEVKLLREGIIRGARFFVDQEQDLLYKLSQNPGNDELVQEIRRQLATHFPEHFSFTLTDPEGVPYYEDYGETIGELCMTNIRRMSVDKHPDKLIVHPGPGVYHFDVMVPWSYGGIPRGIFFKSYRLDKLAKLLSISKPNNQKLIIVRQSEPDLIEITEEGGRDIIGLYRDVRLTANEIDRIGAKLPLDDSDWALVSIYDESLFEDHYKNNLYPAIVFWVILVLLGSVFVYLLFREEKSRLYAENELQKVNSHLEEKVKIRTQSINEVNEQLKQEIKRRDEAETTQKILFSAASQSNEMMFITDPQGYFLYVNKKFLETLGYKEHEVIGESTRILKSELVNHSVYKELWQTITNKETFVGVLINRTKSGEIVYMDETISPILDTSGNIEYFIVNALDITEKTANQEHIQYITNRDLLTGLYNKEFLKSYINQYIIDSSGSGRLAFFYISLKRFEQIYEGLGVSNGNLFIKQFGERLNNLLNENEILARIGTNEFAVVATDMQADHEIIGICEKLNRGVSRALEIDKQEINVSINIGIALYAQDGENFDGLMGSAFSALNRCKVQETAYCFYQDGQTQRAAEGLLLERELRKAITEKSFEFFYQPKVSIQDGRLLGFESLCRWKDRDGQFVSPEIFIPMLEELDLITEHCELALMGAAELVENCQKTGIDLRIAINLSAKQFKDKSLASSLKRQWQECGLSSDNLEFEVTEGALIHSVEDTAETLTNLQKDGVHISLDDFGTGYSSMQYLKMMPFNVLKIDKSFVINLEKQNDQDCTFVSSIIAMAHALNMQVIAEGVETQEHWDILAAYGCDMVQGYFVSRPIPKSELTEWVQTYYEQKV